MEAGRPPVTQGRVVVAWPRVVMREVAEKAALPFFPSLLLSRTHTNRTVTKCGNYGPGLQFECCER